VPRPTPTLQDASVLLAEVLKEPKDITIARYRRLHEAIRQWAFATDEDANREEAWEEAWDDFSKAYREHTILMHLLYKDPDYRLQIQQTHLAERRHSLR
jgi:hypothetical protein